MAETIENPAIQGQITACCNVGNVIYAFSNLGHVYRVTPNPFAVEALLTPPTAPASSGPLRATQKPLARSQEGVELPSPLGPEFISRSEPVRGL